MGKKDDKKDVIKKCPTCDNGWIHHPSLPGGKAECPWCNGTGYR